MTDRNIITELDRLHHRATDMRARERQLADAGENDPASDTWKTAAILAASAESEFEGALVEAWPSVAELAREAEQWRARESETQETLQAIGEEFGVRGGEPRVDGIRRVLTEQRDQLSALLREAGEAWMPIESAPRDGTSILAVVAGCHPKTGIPFIAEVVEWSGSSWWNEMWGDETDNVGPYNPTHWRLLPAPPAAGGA